MVQKSQTTTWDGGKTTNSSFRWVHPEKLTAGTQKSPNLKGEPSSIHLQFSGTKSEFFSRVLHLYWYTCWVRMLTALSNNAKHQGLAAKLYSKGTPTYPCFAYLRLPQTPKWKEFLHKLLVGGLGYVSGVCWKVLSFIPLPNPGKTWRIDCERRQILGPPDIEWTNPKHPWDLWIFQDAESVTKNDSRMRIPDYVPLLQGFKQGYPWYLLCSLGFIGDYNP